MPADVTTGASAGARLRRDAERNRQRILTEARRLFAEVGLGVSHEEIAQAAEVGVGTVYRRFPDKEALRDEIFRGQVDHVVGLAEAARERPDAWPALRNLLEQIVVLQAASRGLHEVLSGSPHAPSLARYAHRRIAPVVADLLRRAQGAGQVRPDVAVTDVALVPLMVAPVVTGGGQALARRALALLLAGLEAPAAAAPLPAAAPTAGELEQLLSRTRVTARRAE